MDSHTTPSHATSAPTELVVLLEVELERREDSNKMGFWIPRYFCSLLSYTGNVQNVPPCVRWFHQTRLKQCTRQIYPECLADVCGSDLWPLCSVGNSSSKALQSVCRSRRAGCRETRWKVAMWAKAKKHGSRPESLPSTWHSEEHWCFVYRGENVNYLFEVFFTQTIIDIVFHFGVLLVSGYSFLLPNEINY